MTANPAAAPIAASPPPPTPEPLPNDQAASGRSFDGTELALLKEALDSGCLTATKGDQVRLLQEEFAAMIGVKHALACTSGSAAMHCMVAALDLEPGEELIGTPITDMGSVAAILAQGVVPVFADVDPVTLNVTAETLEARITDRTRAIAVTHLFGNPCDMDAILAMADRHGLPVLEDAAQALGARSQGRPAGSMGAMAAFSLQQGKHVTTGEGGLVVTNDDALARRLFLFINKAWGYGDAKPDHYFLAPNYRMSELQGAVARAQFRKLPDLLDRRLHAACVLIGRLMAIDGITTPPVKPGDTCSYWRIPIRVEPGVIPGGVDALVAGLRELGIPAAPRYIQKPAFECEVIREQKTFGTSRWPFSLAQASATDHRPELFPGSYDGLKHVVILPLNEGFTEAHADRIASAVEQTVASLHAEAGATRGGAA
ncbi:DegT/DnrJ/EryC1/StrS family aminotransferase [Phycisphaera mikurensis]|uniref:Putative aminotransferase n=1 Tax=Phycisphaera mikurensis (strain NBRC 102666 / KCTC 22515 / FYK2301M01) TaxID=1142394 RepID=I0IFJ5_PHYMF|nr:DegT/DnrJ/EryC1/StrS family aminotransferase [Phycisphaera mikurensis]MBB6440575.1 dTDP-4-amino-4,6-dideoxygalactose transaminase [Phycisphaera mikurensis]BAM04033.1 putative aminotransferase [Phycisphaera mikurensis NBRC 102666]